MNFYVLMKQTFDTEEKIILKDRKISDEGVEYIINPYDEYAVEEAIRLREAHGGEVTVISVGSERVESSLRTALAMGADRAIRLSIGDDGEEHELDEYTVSQLLYQILKDQPYQLILAGNMAVDDGSGQVGARVAELLGIPQVTTIVKIAIQGDDVMVDRDVEGDTEIIATALPLLVTAQQGLNEPRYPSLQGIMKAKKKPLDVLTLEDLGVTWEEVASKTKKVDTFLPPPKQAGRILKGELQEQVKELVYLLQHEAKVISLD